MHRAIYVFPRENFIGTFPLPRGRLLGMLILVQFDLSTSETEVEVKEI